MLSLEIWWKMGCQRVTREPSRDLVEHWVPVTRVLRKGGFCCSKGGSVEERERMSSGGCCPQGRTQWQTPLLGNLVERNCLFCLSFSLTKVFSLRLPELLCISISPSLPICLHTRVPASKLGEGGETPSAWQGSGICALQVLQNSLAQTSRQMREK